MKARITFYALIGAWCVFPAALAYGANDCCWDWSPKEPGKADATPNLPYNEKTDWAVCVKAPTKGGDPPNVQDSPCFARKGRQMVWQGWECLKAPLPAPDGSMPPEPWTGFYCFNKTDLREAPQLKSGPPTPPPDGPDPPDDAVEEGPGPTDLGDVCDTARWPNMTVNMCAMSVGLTDPEGDGGYDNCWGGYGQRDAWYHFVATDTQHRIRTDVGSVETDTHFQVYSGGCAGLTEIACSEDEIAAGWYGDICVDGLTPGQEYHIQLGTYAVDHDYYGPSYNWCNYYQSMTFAVDVSTKFDDKANEICGDGVVNSPCEECETDADCEGGWLCDQECKCSIPPPVPMLPTWGLVGLGLLLLAGGAMVFGRRRAVA